MERVTERTKLQGRSCRNAEPASEGNEQADRGEASIIGLGNYWRGGVSVNEWKESFKQ